MSLITLRLDAFGTCLRSRPEDAGAERPGCTGRVVHGSDLSSTLLARSWTWARMTHLGAAKAIVQYQTNPLRFTQPLKLPQLASNGPWADGLCGQRGCGGAASKLGPESVA